MQGKESPPRSLLIGAVAGSIVALGVLGLSLYAIAQGLIHTQLIYIAEGVVPLLFSGWALWILGGFWVSRIRHRP